MQPIRTYHLGGLVVGGARRLHIGATGSRGAIQGCIDLSPEDYRLASEVRACGRHRRGIFAPAGVWRPERAAISIWASASALESSAQLVRIAYQAVPATYDQRDCGNFFARVTVGRLPRAQQPGHLEVGPVLVLSPGTSPSRHVAPGDIKIPAISLAHGLSLVGRSGSARRSISPLVTPLEQTSDATPSGSGRCSFAPS